ncbi:regulation of nuclear pre-mRNA domain-containing protein 2 [Caerostris extrusa]|uniref:Regulation of nuclear pre-mRNA domain-containing protein 2 n=1 Tax=Caerostris extrusa TaxID=172846 RepID=A0AAV4PAJ7_CAEEX|nr:regulation of nuclear pre-mRNA domain-containing protein 2 [Caerostris extrusa]
MKLEGETSSKLSSVNLSKLNAATNAEILHQLKDRVHGQQFKRDFDKNTSHAEEYVVLKEQEIKERTELILLLEQSEIYYDTQRGEAKIVANAYKNFESKVKALQKSLVEKLSTFPSPVPSPSVDAPSPTTSDHELELNLPSDNKQSGMTSWLEAFSAKKDSIEIPALSPEPKQNTSSSLDSRLSNLLQNIPNLPSGLQNKLNEPPSSGALTPVKDEYSGQNTPLQDEDTHSSHSFFTKLASSNKVQSPKDILKGLTSLIQSATSEKDPLGKEKFSTFGSTDFYSQSSGMSSFIKGIIPSSTQQSSTSSAYYTTSQSSLPASERTFPSTAATTVNSYSTATFNSVSSYSTRSTAAEQHLSFIPSLVTSTPLDNFSFNNKTFPVDKYNPEMEVFNTDMDLEIPLDAGHNVSSQQMENLSPPISVETNASRGTIPGRRLSTLITLVTDDTSQSTPSDKGAQENGTQESMPVWPPTVNNQNSLLNIDVMKDSPNEEYFIGKPPEASRTISYYTTPPPIFPPNGENINFIEPIPTTTDHPLSRIETVQSQRESLNNRWFDNSWNENHMQHMGPPDGPPPIRSGPPDRDFFNRNRNFPHPNFHPRQNWSPRFRSHRPDMPQKRSFVGGPFGLRPYGPPPYKRFPFRGRGWARNPPQY